MILLWGITSDGPLARVRAALERLAAPVIFLDQQDILQTEIDLTVSEVARGMLWISGKEIPLETITSVYLRPYDVRRMVEVERAGRESSEWQHAILCENTISCWTELTPALVVNRISAMGSNGSKPYQASWIKSCGFEVPDTLVTTDKEAVESFLEKHGTVIFKSVSEVRSNVSRLSPEHKKRLDDIANCPTQFQEYIEGIDVRVHVVGDEIFACEIESSADDYRCALAQGVELQMRACEMPQELVDKCRALTKTLDLAVAGIDLRRRTDGRWCCFEVNPSPGFTFFEQGTGQPIGDAIARLLATGSVIKR